MLKRELQLRAADLSSQNNQGPTLRKEPFHCFTSE